VYNVQCMLVIQRQVVDARRRELSLILSLSVHLASHSADILESCSDREKAVGNEAFVMLAIVE